MDTFVETFRMRRSLVDGPGQEKDLAYTGSACEAAFAAGAVACGPGALFARFG
jgi:hypothetical protein